MSPRLPSRCFALAVAGVGPALAALRRVPLKLRAALLRVEQRERRVVHDAVVRDQREDALRDAGGAKPG